MLTTGATSNLLLHVSARSDDKSYLLSLSLYAIEFTITPWYWVLAIWTRGMHDFHVVNNTAHVACFHSELEIPCFLPAPLVI